ncbi:class I SAM-dependent methyltransferase [Haloferax namakaokahaiae]|uniref:Class I SAM-dependent methyltransferase n=1 Tax=Haloferax namakaokahaiae TaxID=1748331 RepID=A0ABD5ZI70_9EURY
MQYDSEKFEVVRFDLTRSFAHGDMRALPFADDAFDGVWNCVSFLHVPQDDARRTLREFQRVLTDGGVVYLSVKRGEKAATALIAGTLSGICPTKFARCSSIRRSARCRSKERKIGCKSSRAQLDDPAFPTSHNGTVSSL